QTGSASVTWNAEGGDATSSDQTIDQVTMTPHTASAWTNYSRQLLRQSSFDVEQFIRNDLAAIIAVELDRVGLYGSGASAQPLGLSGTSGILAGGSGLTAFAATTPTYQELVAMHSALAVGNTDNLGDPIFITTPVMRGTLKTALKFPLNFVGTDPA